MSTGYISAELRRLVAARADRLCEYCLIHEDDAFFGCEIDHVISEKHGGPTQAENLAYACLFCNRNKGSDIASLDSAGALIRLYNPRTDRWRDHFKLVGIAILPLSEVGEVTVRLLGFNASERFLERQTLKAVNRYPTEAALRIMMEGAG